MTGHVEGMEIQKRRVAILKETEELVRRRWLQNDMAQDKQGNSVSPRYHEACAWCLHGAVVTATAKVFGDDDIDALYREVRLVVGAVVQYGLGEILPSGWVNDQRVDMLLETWNDEPCRTSDEVLRALAQTADHIESMVPACLHN